MPSRRRERDRKPARKEAFLDSRKVILIVCEGAVTEQDYFKGFERVFRHSRIKVKLSDRRGTPKTLVEIASERKKLAEKAARSQGDQNLAFDSVWCVFDIDDHPFVEDAKNMASANRIQIAVSNPCFELWLLLHFREPPGMQHRNEIEAMLKKFQPDYAKHLYFADYVHGYRDAVRRACQLEALAQQINEPGRNPTTDVYRLLSKIENG